MNIPDRCSLSDLLKLAGNKLSFTAKKIYLQDGGEIEDIDVIRDNDVLYISAGEPFFKTANSNSKKRAQLDRKRERWRYLYIHTQR